MFEGLFEENEEGTAVDSAQSQKHVSSSAPLPPRLNSGICGIYNQGATCYMNSLLQTLLMTPEFRESLFQLGPEELGVLEDKDEKGKKVRIIPIQLQRLFSRLLLLQVQGVRTAELTDSFGWRNNEEVVQHDAQELNRILFSAVEDSLIGTAGQTLIQKLYHGSIVNQIKCEVCSRVSEREEDFLDLCVTVSGNVSLQEGLRRAYVETESLDGRNQYKCDRCNKLVNAKKGAKLRHLPPILTLSLLRFSFDYVKLERFKETGKFTFPLDLNMAEFCENPSSVKDKEYELFSVVIHRGSTHGGHYHAYIRDIDNFGHWTHPDSQEILLPTDPETGKVDFIEFDSPIELIQAILMKHSKDGMAVDKLGAELATQTGVSWNKRFKKQYGPINKFLKKYDDKFNLNPASNWVSLSTYGETLLEMSERRKSSEEESPEKPEKNHKKYTRPLSPPPEIGERWFDFDDSRVKPIRRTEIEKQFSGKESAYMLFYRSKILARNPEDPGNPFQGIPEKIVKEVMEENDKLAKEREEYETKMNKILLEVHFEQFYTYSKGAIQSLTEVGCHLDLEIDRRKTIQELLQAVGELGGELMCDHFVIHSARQLPAGIHLYACLTEFMDKTIQSLGLGHKDGIFVWNGKQIGGEEIKVGPDYEPVFLNITYGNPDQLSQGFPKSMTLSEVKLMVSALTEKDFCNYRLSKLVTKGDDTKCFPIFPEEEGKSLEELKLDNGDQIVCEEADDKDHSLAKKAVFQQTKQMSFIVELRCKERGEDGNYKVIPIIVDKEISIEELKAMVISEQQVHSLQEEGRLRVDDVNLGLRTPLHEDQTIMDAGLKQGMKLVLEQGPAPSSNQITLHFTLTGKNHVDKPYMELMVDRNATIRKCMALMLQKTDVKDDNWHLRQTNAFHEASKVLDDPDLTVDQAHILDGDLILIEQGKLPPKGFLKLEIYLLPHQSADSALDGITSWLIGGVKGLFTSSNTKENPSEPIESSITSHHLGEIIIQKEETLMDLKIQIMTLPAMSEFSIPMVEFLRVRIIEENGLPTTVLRDHKTTLQRLKLTSSSRLGVQILQQEENLNQNQVLLSVIEHKEKREYGPPQELVWDVTRAGATPQVLRQAIADLLVKPMQQIVIAKHFPEKYDWMVLVDAPQQKSQKQGKGKGKVAKVNIRHAPYHLKDGDTIAVKNEAHMTHTKDEFCTEADLEGKVKMFKEAEERKRKRNENRQNNATMDIGGSGDNSTSKRRQEVGIKIHVADFR